MRDGLSASRAADHKSPVRSAPWAVQICVCMVRKTRAWLYLGACEAKDTVSIEHHCAILYCMQMRLSFAQKHTAIIVVSGQQVREAPVEALEVVNTFSNGYIRVPVAPVV